MMKWKLPVIAIFSFVLLTVMALPGCTEEDINKGLFKEKTLPRFENEEDIIAAFQETGEYSQRGYYWGGGVIGIMEASMPLSGEAEGGDQKSASDYSQTNIQVEGVDEADIVKNDGKYIYTLIRNHLVITDAYPIDGSKILSKISLKSDDEYEQTNFNQLYIKDDKLVLLGSKYYSYPYYCGPEYRDTKGIMEEEIARCPGIPPYRSDGTIIRIYDVSDRSDPEMEKEIEFEGRGVSSRLIGKYIYFVVTSYPDYRIFSDENYDGNIIPLMIEDGKVKKIAEANEIGYIPLGIAENFLTVGSIDVETKEIVKETVAGSAMEIYASENAVYVTSTDWRRFWAWAVKEVPVVGDIAQEVDKALPPDVEKTIINRFGIADGNVYYSGQGAVPGTVLNQFSMDEYNGKFRIATTTRQSWWSNERSKNNLYVLDEDMETIGKLEGLAPGEQIYSARFIGEKAYMVTFRRIDPLFVIDVSDPENPEVLGKLKIPGYSDYLHPIDETHLIGVGKHTEESKEGDFVWFQGMKMAIFDVSDVENPIELHKIIIGDRGTDSYALQDHKAFLYDREKELLILPIYLREIPEDAKQSEEEPPRWQYTESVFQGAFVFKVTLENGFEELGRITHVTEEDELTSGYYLPSEAYVKRALYIGNVLYTLSDTMIKANSLSTLEWLKDFPFEIADDY